MEMTAVEVKLDGPADERVTSPAISHPGIGCDLARLGELYLWRRFVNQILSKTHWSLSGPMQTGELAISGGENKLPGSKQKLKKRALT